MSPQIRFFPSHTLICSLEHPCGIHMSRNTRNYNVYDVNWINSFFSISGKIKPISHRHLLLTMGDDGRVDGWVGFVCFFQATNSSFWVIFSPKQRQKHLNNHVALVFSLNFRVFLFYGSFNAFVPLAKLSRTFLKETSLFV